MARNVSIAAVNFALKPVPDFEGFANHVKEQIKGTWGADLVLFPELFTFELVTTFPDWKQFKATDFPQISQYTDDYIDLFKGLAKERGQYIVGGSHLVAIGDKYYNIAHLFTPDGQILKHTKTHIFPAEADWLTSEGDEMESFQLPFAKVGFNICYEAEIPECGDSLTEQGVEIILGPSYTFTEHGFWRVRHCAQSRCIEDQVYFVHCCSGGNPGAPLSNSWAQSSILSPCDSIFSAKGIVAEATANREQVVRGIVDIDLLYENRKTGAATTFNDRRRRKALYDKWPTHR
jgi:predicted amidohydrolase